MSYDRVKAATLINSQELAHLNLKNAAYVHSIHDGAEARALDQITMTDILKVVRIRRADGLPIQKMAQDTINIFTFHFIRNSFETHFLIESLDNSTV